MPSALGVKLVQEQQDWDDFVARQFGHDAWLYYISPYDNDRRMYRVGSRLAKIRRIHSNALEQIERQYNQDLHQEYTTLLHIEAQTGQSFHASYENGPEWEFLVMDFIEGTPFADVWRNAGFLRRLELLTRAFSASARLNKHGVYHGDIAAKNLVVKPDGSVHLVDLGDSSIMSPGEAARREWTHALFGRHGPLARNSRKLALRLVPFSQSIYRRVKMRAVRPFALKNRSSEEEELLEQAWRESARWHTSQNAWQAYCSLTVGGKHFPGQRPWLLRWHPISKHVSFEGKRVLDLGCNAGLLGSFAMLYGASDYLGIETEEQLVSSARKMAAAFGVPARFEVTSIDTLDPDVVQEQAWDIVVATSIYNWVSDKERLLTLISTAKEVLYEGHDPLDVELGRLAKAGFRNVQVLTVSELRRPVLYGVKETPAARQPAERQAARRQLSNGPVGNLAKAG